VEPRPIVTATNSSTTTTTTTTLPLVTTTTEPPSTTTIPIVVDENLTQEEAKQVALSSVQLAELSEEEVEKVFASLDVDELSDEEKEQLVAVVTNAPEEVKKTFENEVNVYALGLDTYVPVGSTIDVGTRRALIAATAAAAAVTQIAPSGSAGQSTASKRR
jgi:hypothetical protein